MRICLFTSTFLPKIGGHETVVDELARHLHKSGHEVVVLAQHASVKGTVGKIDVPYKVVRFRKPFSQIWDLGTMERSLIRLHKNWPFEILHSHSSYPTGFTAIKAAKKLKIPVVITPHGSDIAETSRFRNRPVVQKRICHALKQAHAVTILSDYMKDRVLLASPEASTHLVRVPNGIHFDWFSQTAVRPENLPLQSGEKYFLFLGRLHPRKAVDVLIEAFRLAAPHMPDVSLVIAGTGTEEEKLRAQAKTTTVVDKIRFVGAVQGQKKLWLLQNSLALVVPTKSWEAFCVVVMEGMASGVPVIGTKVGGIVDLIEPEKDGFLVKPNDARDLADALRRVSDNSASGIEIGRCGRAKAKNYDWPIVTQQYISLFKSLLEESHP